jgi:hypothetical protein
MSMMKQLIADLNEQYQQQSESCMEELCKQAGVNYKEFEEPPALLRALGKNNYTIRVAPYTVQDKAVGQFLILRKLDTQEFVRGQEVYIHFSDYTVREREVFKEDDIKISVKAVH